MTTFTGTIARRIMLTVRVDPDWLAPRLPDGFVPTVVDGRALGGLCALRWEGLRPAATAALPVGVTVEGLAERWFAHRVGLPHVSGVVVPRRVAGSRPMAMTAERLAGGVVAPAAFRVTRHGEVLHLDVRPRDGGAATHLAVRPAAAHPADAVYGGDRATLDALHACTVAGWAVDRAGRVRASHLQVADPWVATPAEVVALDTDWLPDHAEVDHALVLQDLTATMTTAGAPLPVRQLAVAS